MLRGRKTEPQDLTQDRIEMPLRTFVPLAIILGAIYGALVGDFCIEQAPRMIHVLNAPSPAATASIAIGEHIATLAEPHLK